ncbi:MAG: leucine-rich repeat protein, partial [Lachnospiraceae bacterium]|nr:leucine-rich repeat protein [Lachnospiraceae bacterium]
VNAVKNLIEGIGEVSLASKEKIEAARTAYNALTEAQKKLVPEESLKALTEAEAEYKELEAEAVNAVKNLIEGIGTVSLDSKDKIEAARKAYDALTDAQKALVSADILKVLTDAETTYKKLEEEQGSQNSGKADQEKADEVKKLIEGIGTVSLESKEKIEAARAAYNALTDAQKALVSADTLKILTDAEAAYRKLSEEGNKPPVTEKISISKAQISAIPSQVYTGKAIVPSITVSYNGKNLAKGSDYTVSCKNNINIGTASLTVTGTGGYTGTVTKTFTITVKKNKVYTAGNYKYKITSAKTNGTGTVALTGVKSASVKKKLTKLNIASTVKIGGKKFLVTEIGKNACSGCTKATSATIGANVTKIGQKAFYNCKKLKKISIKTKKLKSIGKNAIKGISAKATISCPKKQKARYKKLFKSSVGFKRSMKIK